MVDPASWQIVDIHNITYQLSTLLLPHYSLKLNTRLLGILRMAQGMKHLVQHWVHLPFLIVGYVSDTSFIRFRKRSPVTATGRLRYMDLDDLRGAARLLQNFLVTSFEPWQHLSYSAQVSFRMSP
jgi:hypothetical protein